MNGVAAAGATIASATDMARFLITQMSAGVALNGNRVVSAANLTETHRPGILFLGRLTNPTPFR